MNRFSNVISKIVGKKKNSGLKNTCMKRNDSIDVSVIIPFFNVEQYISTCFDSVIKAIKEINAEVILIDDGSFDNSVSIAKDYSKRNDSFHYYRQDNKGPGAARNYGVSLAKGKYLLFVDADDYIEPDMISNLLTANETNDTEMAVCFVCRDIDNKRIDSHLHERAFHHLENYITHINEHVNFIYDSTVWNKLILTAFYKNNNLSFPEGCLYEDMGITTKMHYYAHKVSIVPKIGYHWRVRDNDAPQSITSTGADEQSLIDKINMMEALLSFVADDIHNADIKHALLHKYFLMDFWFVLNNLFLISDETANKLVSIIRAFVQKHLTKDVLSELPVINQQIYHYINNSDLNGIKKTVNYKKVNYYKVPLSIEDGTIEMSLDDEIFSIDSRDACMDILEMAPSFQIISSTLNDEGLCMTGYVYKGRVGSNIINEQIVQAKLINVLNGKVLTLPCKSIDSTQFRPPTNHLINCDNYSSYCYCYEAAGFQVSIPYRFTEDIKKMTGLNVIRVDYCNRFDSGDFYIKNISKEARRAIKQFKYDNDNTIGNLFFSTRDTLILQIDSKSN